ncbi:winged helix-turn-helix transcriptional regulator [Streptomyces sp. SID10853]|uniref:MarR family winged helix-turn-helix transcriptional regulator n=1 Tax=Streptomyces sp. SID10853 TaxID=2706028 RepID=UPI0013BFC0B7|nr:MarR family winged helix-turn-helix transcriptional regulator [Streptomyces sp. SID10853]NDZ77085.1 winged helix-turn-helix transcriptional regulator [Streptomyces sp. SID10853]
MSGSGVGDSDAWWAGVLLRQVHQRKHQAIDAALASLGTSMSQYVVLVAVADTPGSSAHELAARTAQTDQSLGALIRRLVDKGLVERASGPGRVHRHRLSAQGYDLVARCEGPVTRVLAEEFSALSDAELSLLRSLLERL